MDEETEFLLKRVSQEARRAIAADHPEAAEAHEEMTLRYSARAGASLQDQDSAA